MLGRNTPHGEPVRTIVCVPCVDCSGIEVQVATIGTAIGACPIVAVRTGVVDSTIGVIPVACGGKK